MSGPSDPILNCVTLACCGAAEAAEALASWLHESYHVPRAQAKPCAEALIEHFDLAEKGTLQPLIQSVKRLLSAQG